MCLRLYINTVHFSYLQGEHKQKKNADLFLMWLNLLWLEIRIRYLLYDYFNSLIAENRNYKINYLGFEDYNRI